MRKLDTVQKRENLNEVYACDAPGPGGANHEYLIRASFDGCIVDLLQILFQKGARYESSSIHGITDQDLLEIVKDRLTAFQEGPFSCNHNELALEHIELALQALNQRVEDRIERGVLGENKK